MKGTNTQNFHWWKKKNAYYRLWCRNVTKHSAALHTKNCNCEYESVTPVDDGRQRGTTSAQITFRAIWWATANQNHPSVRGVSRLDPGDIFLQNKVAGVIITPVSDCSRPLLCKLIDAFRRHFVCSNNSWIFISLIKHLRNVKGCKWHMRAVLLETLCGSLSSCLLSPSSPPVGFLFVDIVKTPFTHLQLLMWPQLSSYSLF